MYKGEYFNSISHLIGAIAGLVGWVVLIIVALRHGDIWKVVSFGIFGTTLFFLYLVSTLYHSLQGPAKAVFKLLDYHAIYLLIAGTYTPFTLVTLRDGWGWPLFAVIWSLAIFGIVWDTLFHQGRRLVPLIVYLTMGWLILVALVPLWRALGWAGFMLLLLGGIFYTVGVVFFVLGSRKHFHGIWHLFVLAGSVTHYFTVLCFV